MAEIKEHEKKIAKKRKDSKGRVLRSGESERANHTYDFRYTDTNGERKSIYAETLTELRIKEDEIKELLNKNLNTKGAKITVDKMTEIYLETKKNLAVSTRSGYEDVKRLYIEKSCFGRKKITEVTRSDVLKFYNDLYDRGLSLGYIEVIHHLLHPAFTLAVEDNYITKNPSSEALKNLKNDWNSPESREALTQAQQDVFLEYAKYNVYLEETYYMIIILLETCLRVSEMFGLTWKDVSFEKNEINIDHQLIYGRIGKKFQYYIAKPKNKTSVRKVPLTKKAKRAFIMLQEIYSAPAYECDIILSGYSNFIFRTRKGGLLKEQELQRSLSSLVRTYNAKEKKIAFFEEREPFILPDICPHMLRHTGCTRLAEKGIDPKALQRIMGHATLKMTMELYNHGSDDRVKNEMERLGLIEAENKRDKELA